MPQKDNKFQSKSRKFSGKPKPKGGGGGRDRGKPSDRAEKRGGGKNRDDKKPYAARSRPRRDDRDGEKKSYTPRGRPRRDDRDDRKDDRKKPYAPRSRSHDDDGRSDRKKPYTSRPRRDGDRPQGRKSYDARPPRRDDREPEKKPRTTSRPRREGKLDMGDKRKYGSPSPLFLYGHHAVGAALINPDRTVTRLLGTESGLAQVRGALTKAKSLGLTRPDPVVVEKEDIDTLLPRGAVHQGVLLDAEPLEEVFLQDILIRAEKKDVVLILDQVTDPHNVGAILRSAAAFGAKAVIVQKIHAPDITGALAKVASGAVEHVPLVREVNLSRTLEALKEEAFFCIGLDERGEKTLAETLQPEGRTALVLGAEGDGLRRLVGENCDALAKLPTSGTIASLNVSNAAAVALYEMARL